MLKKPVEVVKGQILADWAQKPPKPYFIVMSLDSMIGEDFGIITGWDPSVCKSNRLHVDILRISFINSEYIL